MAVLMYINYLLFEMIILYLDIIMRYNLFLIESHLEMYIT